MRGRNFNRNFIHAETEFRLYGAGVQSRRVGTRTWETVTLAALARDYSVDAGPWPWLEEHRIAHPTQSRHKPEAEARGASTVWIRLQLGRDDAEKLDKLAKTTQTTKSELVSRWICREVGTKDG